MPTAFFQARQPIVTKPTFSRLPKCGRCGLFKHCKSPKMLPAGEGRRKILVIGESPGNEEDDRGEPFVGKSGRHLRDVLEQVGIDLRKDCLLTNSLICHPEGN